MIDPTLEAAFASTATAKLPGRSYSPSLPVGEHTVILKQFNVKQTQNKGRMFEADVLVLESTDAKLVGQTRGAAWFPGGDKFGIQDGYLRGFMEAAAACIGDTSPLPTFGAVLAGAGQAGRGLMLRVIVREQVAAKTGQAKINPKTNSPYTEMMWYPVSQSLDDITGRRTALDADPAHAIRVAQPQQAQVQQTIAPPVVQPAPVQAAAPAPTGGAGAGLLAALQNKK